MKKKISRIVAMCMIFVMCISNMNFVAWAEDAATTDLIEGTCGTNLSWSLNSDGTLIISGSGDMTDYDDVGSSPWSSNYTDRIKEIVVEEGVSSIGDYAFGQCVNVGNVELADSVQEIGVYAFASCESIKTITIPTGVTKIEQQTFFLCSSLEDVNLPSTIETIGVGSFYGCYNLSKLLLPSSLAAIETNAFDATNLTDVYYSGSESQWKNVVVTNNNTLMKATMHYDVDDLSSHTYSLVSSSNATCTEPGYNSFECTCGAVQKEKFESATGHAEVIDTSVEPTCTETGLTEGSHCSVCGEVTVEQEVLPAKGHTEVTLEEKAATCTTDGMTNGKYCSTCNEVLVAQSVINATGHEEKILAGKVATCTTTGLTEGVFCSVCNEVFEEQKIIPRIEHSWSDTMIYERTSATCAEGNTYYKECSVCHTSSEAITDEFWVDVSTKLNHEYGQKSIIQEATCTEKGITEMACIHCGDTILKEIEPLDHNVVKDTAVAPTCSETGLTEGSHCSVCNEVLLAQEEVEAVGHTFKNGKCNICACYEIEQGLQKKFYVSSTWNFESVYMQISKHRVYGVEAAPSGWTYDSNGMRYNYVFAVEGNLLGDDEITLYGSLSGFTVNLGTVKVCVVEHTHEETILDAVAPTCLDDGKTEGSYCCECNQVLVKQDSIPATGHKYEVTDYYYGTIYEPGYTVKTCINCNDEQKKEHYIDVENIQLNKDKYVYTEKNISPKIVVYDNNGNVIPIDWFEGNFETFPIGKCEEHDGECKNVGQHGISIDYSYFNGKSSVNGTYKLYFNIEAASINTKKATLSQTTYTYNGKERKPTVTIKGLTKGTDYTVSYKNNVNAGTATVTIKGKGNYTGTITKTFKINPKKISKATLGTTSYYYNGSTKKPTVTVKAGDKVILSAKKTGNSNISLSYASGRKKPGTYKVTIKGKGNYTGTITKTFKIKVKNTSVKSLTKGSKRFTVKWSKLDSKYITGYQIRYSRNSSMSNAKKTALISRSTTSKTIKGLSAKKKYYVQIRTYKKIDGKIYYSDWSTKKTVTTKS